MVCRKEYLYHGKAVSNTVPKDSFYFEAELLSYGKNLPDSLPANKKTPLSSKFCLAVQHTCNGQLQKLYIFERQTLHCSENPIYVFPEKEWRGLSPNFHVHVSVSDLFIPRISPNFPAAD